MRDEFDDDEGWVVEVPIWAVLFGVVLALIIMVVLWIS